MLEVHDDVPVPEPVDGEVLIRVRACGMNNTDINTRVGWYSKEVTEATSSDSVERVRENGTWGGDDGINYLDATWQLQMDKKIDLLRRF